MMKRNVVSTMHARARAHTHRSAASRRSDEDLCHLITDTWKQPKWKQHTDSSLQWAHYEWSSPQHINRFITEHIFTGY